MSLVQRYADWREGRLILKHNALKHEGSFAWGLTELGLEDTAGAPARSLAEYVNKHLANSDEFYALPEQIDYSLISSHLTFPSGVEVQMLELDWPNLNKDRDGNPRPLAYVHGELFGVQGVKTTPDNPRGDRSMSVENRCKPRNEWNTYDVVAVDGVLKLSVNGKFVNGISKATQKKGYICVESEGAKIYFRNIRILELPPGVE